MSVMGWKNYTLGAITKGFLWVGKCIIGRCVKYENDESATNLISFRVLLANIEDFSWTMKTTRTAEIQLNYCISSRAEN